MKTPAEQECEDVGAPSYQECFDALPAYTIVLDADLRIQHANKRFADDFGTVEGRHCYDVCRQRDEPCDPCPVAHTFADGERHRSDETILGPDGQTLPVILRTSPIRGDNGDVRSVLASYIDITDITPLRHYLEESHERYHQLFESVPCYISIQDRDLRIIEANKRFREAFGAPQRRHCFQVYKHCQEECVPCSVKQTFQDGQIHHSEEVVTSITGERINTLVYSAPIRDRDGNIESVMEMSTNITPIRELQTQLEGTGLLISSVSHGVKGLLNGLDGGLYLLNSGFDKNDAKRQEQGLEMVKRNAARIRDQVMNILYYARERVPQWETIDAPELCQDVLNMLEAKAAEMGVTLQGQFDPSSGDLEVDPQALRSMLLNLLENSLDACRVDEDKPDHRVSFRLRATTSVVRFEVQDNGIGMDQETREKAFSVFFTSKGVKGTGLGLFIAEKIAKSHGGRIEIESELGRGTCITILLPRRKPASGVESPSQETDTDPA